MSKPANKLRLGPLPKTELVKITITCTVATKGNLDRYATLYAQTYGEAVDAAVLIPHMLETFMARDRGFRRTDPLAGPATRPDASPAAESQAMEDPASEGGVEHGKNRRAVSASVRSAQIGAPATSPPHSVSPPPSQ